MIVTCYYINENNNFLGGRPKSYSFRYLNGILKLSENNQKKVIYTSQNNFEVLKNFLYERLDENKLSLYEIKIFDLTKQKFHERIQKLKGVIGYVNDRCLEIQYGKFEFLLNELNNNENEEYLWWVDAGLINEHLFPKKYIINLNDYNIFNDIFFVKLKEKINKKLFFICGDRENQYLHGKPDIKFFNKNYQHRYHPVGGFFGGERNLLNIFLSECNKKIDLVLNNDKLYSEEIIMEIVFSENIENYQYDTFTTWKHEERGLDLKIYEKDFEKNYKSYYTTFLL